MLELEERLEGILCGLRISSAQQAGVGLHLYSWGPQEIQGAAEENLELEITTQQ